MIGFGQFQEKLDSVRNISESNNIPTMLTTVYNYNPQGRCLNGITMYDSSLVFLDDNQNICFSDDGTVEKRIVIE